MPELQEALHISQMPRQETVLPFDGTDKAFTLHVGGEAVVTLFSEGGFLFKLTSKGQVLRLNPSDLWLRDSMVLANQGGDWVMTAEPDEKIDIMVALVPSEARLRATELTRRDFSSLVLQNRRDLRAMLIGALLAAGVFAEKTLLESFVGSIEQNLAVVSSLNPIENP